MHFLASVLMAPVPFGLVLVLMVWAGGLGAGLVAARHAAAVKREREVQAPLVLAAKGLPIPPAPHLTAINGGRR